MNSNKVIPNLNTMYIKTNDGHVGVIVGETATQLLVNMPFDTAKHFTRFMKVSRRQVNANNRTFDYVNSFSEV